MSEMTCSEDKVSGWHLNPWASRAAAYLHFKSTRTHQCFTIKVVGTSIIWYLCLWTQFIGSLIFSRLVSGPGSFNQNSKVLEFTQTRYHCPTHRIEGMTGPDTLIQLFCRDGFDWRPLQLKNNSVQTFNAMKNYSSQFRWLVINRGWTHQWSLRVRIPKLHSSLWIGHPFLAQMKVIFILGKNK